LGEFLFTIDYSLSSAWINFCSNKFCSMSFASRKFFYGDIPGENLGGGGSDTTKEWPLWEVFIRSKQGLDHKHVGSLHATDAKMAIENARDVYTRRQEGISIWVVESKYIHASNPDEAESFYE